MTSRMPDGSRRRVKMTARDMLAALLAVGPMPADQVRARATEAGISWRSMQRASLSMNVERSKGGMNSGWTWSLPAMPSEGANNLAPSVDPRSQGHTTCLAAYGYEVPDDGLMHGVPYRD